MKYGSSFCVQDTLFNLWGELPITFNVFSYLLANRAVEVFDMALRSDFTYRTSKRKNIITHGTFEIRSFVFHKL